MDTPFLGYIAMVGFNFAPRGWAICNGKLLPISQYEALYALIGTTYGGDGVPTFALPDLRSRIPLHFGQGPGLSSYIQGQVGGFETVTLNSNQIPSHPHLPNCFAGAGNSANPAGGLWATTGGDTVYELELPPGAAMLPQALAPAGNSLPHSNIQPLQVINFVIALEGVFPSQN